MKSQKALAILLSSSMVLSACSAQTAPAPSAETTAAETATAAQETTAETTPELSSSLTPGTYTIDAVGFGGSYTVSVTVDDGKITDITPGDNHETMGIGTSALEQVSAAIVENQSVNVDILSGATISSASLKSAVRKALTEAGAPEDSFNEDCRTQVISPTELADFNQDIIVVGAGWAGLMSALEAAEAGAKVLLIEKTTHLGGAGTYSGARISGAGTSIQEKAGIEDSPQFYYEFLKDQAAPAGTFNETLAKTYSQESGPTVERLMEQWGFEFDPQPTYTYDKENADRTYPGIGAGMGFTVHFNELINEKVLAGQIFVLRETEVTHLQMEDGAVTGVEVQLKDGTSGQFQAKSVILATGGYAHNSELLHKGFTRVGSSTVSQADGSGFAMAEEAGAALVNMDYSKCDPGMLDLGYFDLTYQANPLYPGAVWIDIHGNRFVDETSLNIEQKSLQWYQAEENTVFLLLTESMLDDATPILSKTAYAFPDTDNEEFKRQVESEEVIFKADTIEELAQKMDVDREVLKKTIEQYNTDAAAGKDSVYGRTENLISFEEGPFYAIETIPSVLCSFGGVSVNENAQVLNTNHETIPGLYAAGEIIGASNITGYAPFSGGFLGMCVTFGRIAGTKAAQNALE